MIWLIILVFDGNNNENDIYLFNKNDFNLFGNYYSKIK